MSKPKAKRTSVVTTLSRDELRMLCKVRHFVWSYTGIRSNAEALRFLVRNWSKP